MTGMAPPMRNVRCDPDLGEAVGAKMTSAEMSSSQGRRRGTVKLMRRLSRLQVAGDVHLAQRGLAAGAHVLPDP